MPNVVSNRSSQVRLSFFLVVLFSSFLLIGCTRSSEQGLGPGRVAPSWTLPNLNGETGSLEDFKGRTVLINFWATWCDPCREEMPSLERLSEQFSGLPFSVIAIAVENNGSLAQQRVVVSNFIQQHNLTFPVFIDERGDVAARYGVNGFPESFVIGADGKMLMLQDAETSRLTVRIVGPRAWDSLAILQQLRALTGRAL